MSAAYALLIFGCSAVLAVGAELRGSWSTSSSAGQNFGGSWTAEAHQESGGVTGAWTLYDASGKMILRGGWSASKSPQRRLARHRNGPGQQLLGNMDGHDAAPAEIANDRNARVRFTRCADGDMEVRRAFRLVVDPHVSMTAKCPHVILDFVAATWACSSVG